MKVLVSSSAPNGYLPGTNSNNRAYSDNTDNANTASASTGAAPLGSRYRDEDLPPYEETPLIPAVAGAKQLPKRQPEVRRRWYQPPPDLPFSGHDGGNRRVYTRFPDYSTDAETLRQMVYEQASYPPTYYMELTGTHIETTYRGGNGLPPSSNHRRSSQSSANSGTKSENTITDFFIRINITHLLTPGPNVGGELLLLADDQKGYRGGCIKRCTPSIGSSDIENQHDELKAWCDKYVADPSRLKSFTLTRQVINHDTEKLDSLLRSLVASTNYRGKVSIHFPIAHGSVTVYSPGILNKWRMTTWIRWFFYLTFLWIFSWLFLFIGTARYETVMVVFPYADISPEEGNMGFPRRSTVMSETTWFDLWKQAIRRGVLGRLNCGQGEINDEYRLATEEVAARGAGHGGAAIVYPDGVEGLFGVGTQFAGQWQERESWGYDC
ncbi:Uncharacterized protein BP5553_09117 [Venustampulla echinocandica]|uniref:Uncharacterized protein n=1 Tax=Venustampulla echinocandica TaxID=2656787 RepID=A0A370TE08_9HELO|nr:Uncharacterized protein BP5553_09117 [Venustampulla echinocandica]RDL32661.1 Uncharacterized protein BP5553_09117 [Venustampulla echinocandica]